MLTQTKTEAVVAAWNQYRERVESIRETIFAQPWAERDDARASAISFFLEVQAAAFNLVIAPKRNYPEFYLHTIYEPLVYTHSLPAADFIYRMAFLDGRRAYRIWGKRHNSLGLDIQGISKLFGAPGARRLGNWDLDNFEVAADGSFEIAVSAQPQPGNWIPLDPESDDNLFMLREFFAHWETEKPVELHIELADGKPAGAVVHAEDEYIRRLDLAAKFIEFIVMEWSLKLTQRTLANVGHNAFWDGLFNTNANPGAANNPTAIYPGALYLIEPGEALIIECEIPAARYWNVQLGNAWWQAMDFVHHQSSLNATQAVLDDDGRFRAVISLDDPGVPNWLNPLGACLGVVLFRFYNFDRQVMPAVAQIVSAGEVRRYLPANTPHVTPAAREEILRRRRNAAKARFGR
jgi:hypothetical protein